MRNYLRLDHYLMFSMVLVAGCATEATQQPSAPAQQTTAPAVGVKLAVIPKGIRAGALVEAVVLPPEDSLRDEVAYATGALANSPRKAMAEKYLEFLKSTENQQAYAKYGFVNATAEELGLRPIP